MFLLKARPEYAREISELICGNLKNINSRDYTPEQIEAWASVNSPGRIRNSIEKNKIFVLVDGDQIMGVCSLNPETGMLGSFFVKYNYHNRGYGTELLKYVENYAERRGIRVLNVNSTITAYYFYARRGYEKIRDVKDCLGIMEIPAACLSKRRKSGFFLCSLHR